MPESQVHAIYIRYMNDLDKQVEEIPENNNEEEGEF